MMKVALGQFAVAPDWETNQRQCLDLIAQAKAGGAELLLLPEGILAQDINNPELLPQTAQPLDGPFMEGLRAASQGIAVAGCVNVPDGHGRFYNTQFVLRDGAFIAQYRKLHLYDAFSMKESQRTSPGLELPPVVQIGDMKVGLMTCYDVRFPELARHLALAGAEAILLPAAWVRGPMKERHWEIMAVARALENTCYVVAVGECGARNCGASMVVDPLGVIALALGEAPALGFATLDRERIAHARRVLPVLQNRRFADPALADR
ncbi:MULTISPECIES: deaminated glutathione amidase [Gluconobacter]|uniref:Hydrolase n=2 Tax=Gluconobacter albidus TaxID=318683 RepID=A0A149SYR4_9PROT|nr:MULTISPECIES: deaminated glutathione amidase [Gluconobacter]KXV37159.1 hydrolase [Gluconobacter albidus]KXV46863.1 hydrolase [Gluconobacter albidus]MCP1273503.1 deaminated glutathione amidase [Gluconobacter albidus]OUI83947.1 hydrolase [Gluconobacter sp. DsW_056]